MAYTTINKSTDYFNTKLYTGNGSARSITGVGFQPDMVWGKCRNNASWHNIVDVVRGVTKVIVPNETDAESTRANGVTAFGADGFSVGTDGNFNGNNDTYAVWNWKAAGSTASNSSGSITSTVSANTTSGFSIVSFTGTGANATVGHGLGVAPKVIITKSRANTENWGFYHEDMGNTKQLVLNTTGALTGASAAYYNNTSPTSTVFSVGTADSTNDAANMIAYCFAEKAGYSKFGSYTGNGSTNGTFVYLGFKPAFLIIKKTNATKNWFLHDDKRLGYNPSNSYVNPNLSAAEYAGTDLDIVSNGFKLKSSGGGHNESGHTYIYMAFGQSLVGSNNVVATAR
jgi:hypothetical protein